MSLLLLLHTLTYIIQVYIQNIILDSFYRIDGVHNRVIFLHIRVKYTILIVENPPPST